MTGFGSRGWFELLHALPLTLLLLILVYAIILEILVRKYSFAYRRPLTASLGGIVLLVLGGGFVLAQTSLHRNLAFEERHGRLPPPLGMWYKEPFRSSTHGNIHRGTIIVREPVDESLVPTRFVIFDSHDGTSTVLLSPGTRFPYGEDFGRGDIVIVIGDSEGTSTMRAFGVREIEAN